MEVRVRSVEAKTYHCTPLVLENALLQQNTGKCQGHNIQNTVLQNSGDSQVNGVHDSIRKKSGWRTSQGILIIVPEGVSLRRKH
jgi:hypothetical protein